MAATAPPQARPLARQLAQWRVYVPFYARAIGLQGSHPAVARALVDHSSVYEDPWGRAARTTAYALRFVFGDDRVQAADELRELHRGIGGVDDGGRRYHAWDRDVWTWVHLTTAEALVYAVDVMCGPWPRRDLEAFYEDTRQIGALYGVRQADMPPDLDGLRAYVDEGVASMLVPNPSTDRLRDALAAGDHVRALPLSFPVPLPLSLPLPVPLPLQVPLQLPGPVAAALRRVLALPTHTLLFGAFPAAVRRIWGVRWTPLDQVRYLTALGALRMVTEPLPDRLRMWPLAYRALHDRPAARAGGGL